jgi:hypothetical protein
MTPTHVQHQKPSLPILMTCLVLETTQYEICDFAVLVSMTRRARKLCPWSAYSAHVSASTKEWWRRRNDLTREFLCPENDQSARMHALCVSSLVPLLFQNCSPQESMRLALCHSTTIKGMSSARLWDIKPTPTCTTAPHLNRPLLYPK